MFMEKIKITGLGVIRKGKDWINERVFALAILLFGFGKFSYAQLASGAQNLQGELESFAGPAAIAGVVIGFAIGYFSDDGSIGKKIGYGVMFISIIAGAAEFAGLFGA